MLLKSWKKSIDNGIVIPAKLRFCNECSKEKHCDRCNNQVNENKEIGANLNLLKRKLKTNLVICFLILKNRMIYL